MDQKRSENNPEVAFFIVEGTYRLATISSNDYGFQLSARLALTYLDKAVIMLALKSTMDCAILDEIRKLKAEAAQLTEKYAALEKFCVDYQCFKQLKTHGLIEWGSKLAVQAIARGYLGDISHQLAYKIRIFHAIACSVLVE
jgi:hypothetical protein